MFSEISESLKFRHFIDKNSVVLSDRSRRVVTKMSKLILMFFLGALKLIHAQKCSYVYDVKNVFKTVQCLSLTSMKGIAEEIQPNWTSIEIINRGARMQFAVNSGNQSSKK